MARRGLIIALMAALALAGIGRANAAPLAYITTSTTTGGAVVVIDAGAASPTAGAIVSVGSFPEGVAVSPDGSRVYVANLNSSTVSVIDATTTQPTVTATLTVATPFGVAVSPDGSRLYVTSRDSNSVSVINTATDMFIATVGVGASPHGVAVSPDGSRVYVANSVSNTVSVINTATLAASTMGVGSSPYGLALSPDGSRVYVTNFNDDSVSVINTTPTPVLSATVPLGEFMLDFPVGVAVSPNGSHVYVAEQGLRNRVSVIDAATNMVTATVPVGMTPFGVAVTPDGSRVFVANFGSGSVSMIDATTNIVTATVQVTGAPLAFGKFIAGAITTVPFARFTASANVDVTDGSFVVHGTFTLGAGSRGINPLTDPVTIAMGPFAATIPAGSFTAIGDGQFMFGGTINGVSLTAKISPLGNSTFDLKIEGAGATFTGITSPVTVRVTIGNNEGSTVAETQPQ